MGRMPVKLHETVTRVQRLKTMWERLTKAKYKFQNLYSFKSHRKGKEDAEKENHSILCGSSLFSLVGDSDLHLNKRRELALDLITALLLWVSEFTKQKQSEGGKEPITHVLPVVLSLVGVAFLVFHQQADMPTSLHSNHISKQFKSSLVANYPKVTPKNQTTRKSKTQDYLNVSYEHYFFHKKGMNIFFSP